MCGCERHYDPGAECTCLCPEHAGHGTAFLRDLRPLSYSTIDPDDEDDDA